MSAAGLVSEEELSAYVDGELPRDRALQIAAILEREPALSAHVAELRRQNALLRAALDPVLNEPIPAPLLRAASRAAARSLFMRGGRAWSVFGAAASLVVGLALGWLARGQMIELAGTPVSFQRQAAITHALYASDANRPVEIWAAEEQRMVTWLSKRLGFAVHPPNLNSMGYALVGGRLVAGNEKPAALFMYENDQKQRISLLVRRDRLDAPETAFRYAVEKGVGVFYWIDESCAYALSGNLDRSQLLSVAYVVHGQLTASEAGEKR